MRYLLTAFMLLFSLWVRGQVLVLDSTRFIMGNRCCTGIFDAIATSDSGGLLVGTTSNNPGGIIPSFLLDTFQYNVWVAKINSNRSLGWMRVFGGTGIDAGWSAVQTSDKGFGILCETESNDGDVIGYKGTKDIWLLRLDSNGNLLWKKTYGSTLCDGPISIAKTNGNGFIILGYTNGNDGDVPVHYGGYFSFDWVVIKTDSIGNIEWSNTFGGSGDERIAAGTIISTNDGYFLVGSSNSTDHDCVDTAWHAGMSTASDYYILKLDTAGNKIWAKSYGGSGSDFVANALFNQYDTTLVIGGKSSSSDFMATGTHGNYDMWTIKVDLNGNLCWQKMLGTPEEEDNGSVCLIDSTRIAVYGDVWLGSIGLQDASIYLIYDTVEISRKVLGSIQYEISRKIVKTSNFMISTGVSDAYNLTEGTTYGKNGPGQTSFVSFFTTWPTTTSNIVLDEKLLVVSPNPAHDKVNIAFSGMQNGAITVMNVMGQVVYTTKITAQITSKSIDVNQWANGMYIIIAQGIDEGIITGKFIKE